MLPLGRSERFDRGQEVEPCQAADERGGFDEPSKLKQSANARRKSGQLRQARAVLGVVIDGLKGLHAERRDDARSTAQIRAELADTYGMRGGVVRRLGYLEKQTSARRGDEWWALADLGQFHLLRGDVDAARAAYARGRRTGPRAEEVERDIELLDEFGVALAQDDSALGELIRGFARQMKAELR